MYKDKDGDLDVFKIVRHSTYALVGLIVLFGSFVVVNPGERGIVVRLGQINRTLDSGLHLKLPLVEYTDITNVQTQKEQTDAESASADLQDVHIVVAVNYNVDPSKVSTLFQNVGDSFGATIIDPAIQEAVKAATAKHTAEELMTKREQVKDEIQSALTAKLILNNLVVTSVSIVNFKFSDSFNQAIEAKVTAEQNALAAKNKLDQVKYEADQRVAQAQGEAEAIKIQAQAINSQGGADYVQLKKIEKWNGQGCTSYCGLEASSGFLISK